MGLHPAEQNLTQSKPWSKTGCGHSLTFDGCGRLQSLAYRNCTITDFSLSLSPPLLTLPPPSCPFLSASFSSSGSPGYLSPSFTPPAVSLSLHIYFREIIASFGGLTAVCSLPTVPGIAVVDTGWSLRKTVVLFPPPSPHTNIYI